MKYRPPHPPLAVSLLPSNQATITVQRIGDDVLEVSEMIWDKMRGVALVLTRMQVVVNEWNKIFAFATYDFVIKTKI